MNWMTVLWPMVAATCLTLALINLRIAVGDGRKLPHLFFSLAAISVAAVSFFEFLLMQTESLHEYNRLLRWAAIPISSMVFSVTGFIWSFFGTGRLIIALPAVCIHLIANLINVSSEIPGIRYAASIHKETFCGVTFTAAEIKNGPLNIADISSVILVTIFILGASFRLWKNGNKRRAAFVGGSVIFFLLLGRGHATLIEEGILNSPYFVSVGFIFVILAMGMELGNDVLNTSRLARELNSTQQRMDLATNAVSLGFWEWNIHSGEIWANQAARELFGIPHNLPINFESFLALLHPQDRDHVSQAINRSIKDASDYDIEYRIQLQDGRLRWIAARGRTENSPDKHPARMRGVLLDITEKRESENEIHLIRSQLAHAGRVSMMGQLAASLAHELNQPLGAILRNAEAAELFLQSQSPDINEIRAIIRDILRDDIRAGNVIDRLKALMKRKNIDPRPLQIKDHIEDVLSLLRVDASARGVTLAASIPADLPDVLGDRVHLQQVLINLIINSMDAMTETKRGNRHVTVNACQHQTPGFIKISVRDTGPGIAPDIIHKIFDPFFSTKSEGMGMGLSISRTIIEAHRGTLELESNPHGSCFTFSLPLAQTGALI